MRIRPLALALVAFAQLACASTIPTGAGSSSPQAAPTAVSDGSGKTLVLAQANQFSTLGPFGSNSTSGGGATLMGIHANGLVTLDDKGNSAPRIAAAIPSFADGSLVLVDGKMTTTWKLRPDVTWHDGQSFSARDVAFTQRVRAKVTPGNPEDVSPYIEGVDVVDSTTAVIHWKSTYYNALFLDFRSFWPLPEHILGKALDEGTQEAFLREPYFTTDYVNTGPFRLVDWGLGADMTFERYPGYFLGLPKVEKIVLRVISDPNVIAAGVRAGAIDIVANKALSANLSVVLRDEWKASSEGTVSSRQENWIYLQYQWDPAYQKPPELVQDVKLRQGMYEAVDRVGLREFQFPGVPDTNGDSFIPAADARGPIVGQPFSRYVYNPTKAAQDLADGGWTRAADGRFLDRSGRPVSVEIRAGSPSDQSVVTVMGDAWRKIGIAVTENIGPNTFGTTYGPDVVQWTGLQLTGRGAAEIALSQFQTRQIPRAENRWTGQNTAGYSNPALDAIFDQVFSTLDGNQRASLLKQVGEGLSAELPALPLYWRISFMETRDTVKGPLVNDHAHMGPDINGYNLARNAHLWERV